MSDLSRPSLADCPWLISKEEVAMTEEVIDRGTYSEVRVALFRGLRVAAKSLHNVIISQYYLHIFTREMTIASRLRHPNLLLFIGATTQGRPPIILTELMATSLRAELSQHPLSNGQIKSIAMDVACGLNYLHQWKPHPIIHGDVSSHNVLLKPFRANSWEAKVSGFGPVKSVKQISFNDGPPFISRYAAPEAKFQPYAASEAMFPKDDTPKMDVYSFGVLLVEMCLRRLPEPSPAERASQAKQVQWNSMASIIDNCTAYFHTDRPMLVLVIEKLRQLEV